MTVIGRAVLLVVLSPLVIPLGLIAIMLNPFLEIILEEKNNDTSK